MCPCLRPTSPSPPTRRTTPSTRGRSRTPPASGARPPGWSPGSGSRRRSSTTARTVLPLVRRRHAQHLLQRAGPPRGGGPRRAARRWSTTARSPARSAPTPTPELREEVAAFAGALRQLGVATGDRVVIYMPMIPEAVVAMLACARLGAVHSVVFGGFAAHELAVRIDDAKPKVVLSASCGVEPSRIVEYKPLLDRALDAGRAHGGRGRAQAAPPVRGVHGRGAGRRLGGRDARRAA